MSLLELPATLALVGDYVVALRTFVGTTTLTADFADFEECLRLRVADAGAAAAGRAADEAGLPSLKDFLSAH